MSQCINVNKQLVSKVTADVTRPEVQPRSATDLRHPVAVAFTGSAFGNSVTAGADWWSVARKAEWSRGGEALSSEGGF